jgi:hypothetical protein
MKLRTVASLEHCREHRRLVCPLQQDSPSLQAIHQYCGIGHRTINGYLRKDPDRPATNYSDGEIERLIADIDTAIDNAPRSLAPLRVYRGMPAKPWGFAELVQASDMNNHTLIEPGFMSVSARKEVARGFGTAYDRAILLEIIIPAGTPLFWTSIIQDRLLDTNESEVILPRGGKLTITRATGRGWRGGQVRAEASYRAPEGLVANITKRRWWRRGFG